MTALFTGALALAMRAQTAPAQLDFSVDLLLIGNNGPAMAGWDWIDKPAEDTPIQAVLRDEIAKLQAGDCRYLIVDGGQSSVFIPSMGGRQRGFFYRISTYSPTLVETWKSHGVEHTRKSRYARLNTGESGGYRTAFGMPSGYTEQMFLYVDGGADHSFVEFNDLTTLHTLARDNPSQVPSPDERLTLSEKSVSDTISDLGAEASKGVCFCDWGFTNPAYPNIVSYPPAGVAAHYILSRTHGHLELKFLEYLGSPSLSF